MNPKSCTVAILSCLLLAACGGDIAPGHTGGEPPAVKGLTLATFGSEALPATQLFVGTVESLDRATLTARIDGRIGSLRVKTGERVPAGALLLTIADTPTGARLIEAESTRQTAAARLQLAEQTLARFEKLKAAEAVTPQEFDRVASEAAQARAGLAAAEAAAEQARTIAGYTRVTAPYPARVAATLVDAGTTVLPGTPLLVLDRTGGWQVRLDCPEELAGRLAAGTTLQVEVPALQRTFPATVTEVAPAADPASRSFQVKAALPDEPQLAAGLFARAAHAGGTADTLLIPAGAVVTRGQLTGVYVVEDGRLHWRLLKTGRRIGDRFEVLSGLNSGETLVTAGVERAVSGARVEN
ncbi:MAG: efflux RND transporter periplasmic adaptor subunit [Deltaproteobacteria bacterium]|nr:MAG: efflux RND transporter periplasmic adaptor subunit [Deltaproteobacteria bacterium]